MNIPFTDESQTLIGHPIVKGGVIKIEFKCAHDRVKKVDKVQSDGR